MYGNWPSHTRQILLTYFSQLPPRISSTAAPSIALLRILSVRALSSMLRTDGGRVMSNHEKVVPVRQYQRYRFGRWETVCKHCRSLPKQ